jgi:hypothetical protein
MASLALIVSVTTQHSNESPKIHGIIFKIFIIISQFHDPYEASDHPKLGHDSGF